MKHTPGPWEAKDIPSAGIQIFAKVDIGKEDMSEGTLQPIYHVSLEPSLQVGKDGIVRAMLSFESWRQFPSVNFQEMQKANARLIASAPMLLEACKKCYSLLFNGIKQDLVEELRVAIAKAEGRDNEGD